MQVYQRLYEDGICIVEDFFDDDDNPRDVNDSYPPPLFTCTKQQASFITKTRVSRDTIFDGVIRSTEKCHYKTNIILGKKTTAAKVKIDGPGQRQQLKHNQVRVHVTSVL
jgi:hypothetical protein